MMVSICVPLELGVTGRSVLALNGVPIPDVGIMLVLGEVASRFGLSAAMFSMQHIS
jgi:hypothetical protein